MKTKQKAVKLHLQFFNGGKNKRLEEIEARLTEIRGMLEDDEKRGDTSFKDLEKEVRELNEEIEEIEARQRVLDGTKSEEKEQKEEKRDFDPSQFRKVGGDENPPEDEERASFDKYLETRDITEDGLKLDESYVVVPEEDKKEIIELADDIVSLKQFVTVKPVSTGSGTQPVRTTAKATLKTVAELAESPAIGVTPFTEVDYKVETKRGYIPYSEEYKQDGINLVGDLKQFIGEVVVNTENDDILTALSTVRAKTVASVDELKTLVNTGFKSGKKDRIKFLMSQSVFDNFDRIKDKNGRYLLQESISAATGYKILNKDIVVLDDEYFPNKTTMFVGDLKEIVYFDRSQVRVQWTNYLHFGECLGVAIRNDVGKVEDEKTKVNIYKVTVNIPTEPAEPEVPEGA
ncbi:phage major capsid protein [Oceanobacillus profundus]|uniref:phage major capsid protein n=1 Tax=Oceanobacillus profundus TaxID=372463 RepID=UPI00204212EF|nr:phage major capsid protein [Oceanobacillus profundus]MCM3396789.1 phage major capsid protein [Oceanobacillus profundus]